MVSAPMTIERGCRPATARALRWAFCIATTSGAAPPANSSMPSGHTTRKRNPNSRSSRSRRGDALARIIWGLSVAMYGRMMT